MSDGWPCRVLQVKPDSFKKNDDGTRTYFDHYQVVTPVNTVRQITIERA